MIFGVTEKWLPWGGYSAGTISGPSSPLPVDWATAALTAISKKTKDEIQPGNLPDFKLETGLRKGEVPVLTGAMSLDDSMANFERDLITSILEQNHFSLTKTAEQLKISRHALRYRMQRLNITAGIEDDTSVFVKEGSKG